MITNLERQSSSSIRWLFMQ